MRPIRTAISSLAMASLASLAFSISMPAHAESAKEIASMLDQSKFSIEQALEKGLASAPGKVIDIQLDDDDKKGVRYELEVVNNAQENIEVYVDAVTGQAVIHKNDGKASRKDLGRLEQAKIDIAKAIQSALAAVPGKAFNADLDSHWGKTIYQVDILQTSGDIMEVKIDAQTGAVISSKRD